MSDRLDGPAEMGSPPPELPPNRRSGCLTVFMVLVGVVLLLPGLCAVIFGVLELSEPSVPAEVGGLIVMGLLIGGGGVALIVRALRKDRTPAV